MIKKATMEHFNFIRDLIIHGATEGAFNKRLAELGADELFFDGLAKGMKSGHIIMDGQVNLLNTYLYFNKEKDKKRPLGFVLFMGDGNLTELWMAAIVPEFRKQGLGESMFKQAVWDMNTTNILARCGPGSEGAAHILRKLGFVYLGTGPEGTQFLAGKNMSTSLQVRLSQLFTNAKPA